MHTVTKKAAIGVAAMTLVICGPILWVGREWVRGRSATPVQMADCVEAVSGAVGIDQYHSPDDVRALQRVGLREAPECAPLSRRQRDVLGDLLDGYIDQVVREGVVDV